MKIKFKYQIYLDNYENCPSDDFKEISGRYFRWTHSENTAKNFVPLTIVKEPPPRLLEKDDKLCISYGLSFFDTVQNAFRAYHKNYHKQKREHLKISFKEDKGTHIALVDINNDDGKANEPNKVSGHFTFHEYEHTDFNNKIFSRLSIFEGNGTIKDKISP